MPLRQAASRAVFRTRSELKRPCSCGTGIRTDENKSEQIYEAATRTNHKLGKDPQCLNIPQVRVDLVTELERNLKKIVNSF